MTMYGFIVSLCLFMAKISILGRGSYKHMSMFKVMLPFLICGAIDLILFAVTVATLGGVYLSGAPI